MAAFMVVGKRIRPPRPSVCLHVVSDDLTKFRALHGQYSYLSIEKKINSQVIRPPYSPDECYTTCSEKLTSMIDSARVAPATHVSIAKHLTCSLPDRQAEGSWNSQPQIPLFVSESTNCDGPTRDGLCVIEFEIPAAHALHAEGAPAPELYCRPSAPIGLSHMAVSAR